MQPARELDNRTFIAQIVDLQADGSFYRGDLEAARNLYREGAKEASQPEREHVLRSELQKVRAALSYLERRLSIEHPLASRAMSTDGVDLFCEGQLGMTEILSTYLRRVDWSHAGFAVRLYPFTRKREAAEPRVVVIDPEVSFGKPVLVGTGIPTAAVAERYKAGESVDELAEDYDLGREQVEEAIRCELDAA